MTIVPASSGRPVSANSKNPNGRVPASMPSSFTSRLTGEPSSVSSDPACAANANGTSTRAGACAVRTASTTATGTSAATAPLMLISAVTPATISMTAATTDLGLSPTRRINC